MKRVWRHVLSGLTLTMTVGVTGALVAACVHDDSTIFVSQVLAPQFVTAGMACVFTGDPTQPSLTTGVLDAALSGAYSAWFLIGNQMVPRGNPNQPQTETSYVRIDGVVVRIVDTNDKELSSFTTPTTITVPPSSGTTPGFAPINAVILDSDTVNMLDLASGSKRVTSFVRFFGKTLGGDSVESDEFGFPIDVCTGCLVTFPASEQDPNLKTPNCARANAMSATATSVPCVFGQDFAVDCALCQAFPVCQVNQGIAPITDAGGGG